MNFLRFIFLIASVCLFAGCEEEFSPKADFEEEYVMNAIISRDGGNPGFSPSVQLFRTYDVDGTNPNNNNIDPFLEGAKVFFEVSGSPALELKEKILSSRIKNKYGNPVTVYTTDETLAWPTGEMKIRAKLANGKELWAETKLPKGIHFKFSYPFVRGITSNINHWKHGDYWGIKWVPEREHLYFADFYITYRIVNSAADIKYCEIKVPCRIVDNNGRRELIYTDIIENGEIKIKFDALDYAMKALSDGDAEKSKYIIERIFYSVTEYGNELSNYYDSINGALDQYSIRVDKKTYSNVHGGYGIFGAMRVTYRSFKLEEAYVESFGYKTYL